MNVIVKGMQMPANCGSCPFRLAWCIERIYMVTRPQRCPLIELPDHGDLIDRDAFRKTMYHDTFETDSDLQKWESGCWIRYKMFERNIESAPVIIPAERSEE